MPDQQPLSADLRKLIEQWVATHLGVKGIVALAVLFAIGALWWNWEKIRKLPGIAWFLRRRARRPQPPPPLPRASPGRFAVAVAHLENDRNSEQERLVIEALTEIGAVQVLRFDRVIAPQRDNVEEAVKEGHEQARALLAESGSDVLIWEPCSAASKRPSRNCVGPPRARYPWRTGRGVTR